LPELDLISKVERVVIRRSNMRAIIWTLAVVALLPVSADSPTYPTTGKRTNNINGDISGDISGTQRIKRRYSYKRRPNGMHLCHRDGQGHSICK
jgi:hypothetical protein